MPQCTPSQHKNKGEKKPKNKTKKRSGKKENLCNVLWFK
jgi:hypothetical protein